jgi:hypothetical protein
MKKPGRNDPCVCGSGKKFKKCCERKMIGKKFMATKIDTMQNTSSNISSFFQKKIVQINTNESKNKKSIKADIKENSQKENIPINNSLNLENINS